MTNTAENLILDRFSDEELIEGRADRIAGTGEGAARAAGRKRPRPGVSSQSVTDYQRNQDKLAEALMIILGDPIEALIESKIEYSSQSFFEDLIDRAMQDFDIDDHRCAIDDMIDERLSERLGEQESEDDRHAAIEDIVKDVLSGATVSIDV